MALVEAGPAYPGTELSGLFFLSIDLACPMLPAYNPVGHPIATVNWCALGRYEVDFAEQGSFVVGEDTPCISSSEVKTFAYPTGRYQGFELFIDMDRISGLAWDVLGSFGAVEPVLARALLQDGLGTTGGGLTMVESYSIALLGQPNSGKSTLFNGLTGSHQRVGNWPGKTVEKKLGTCERDGIAYTICDLPGAYSLSAMSEEERITQDYISSGEADVVLIMVDASQLTRSMYMLADYAGGRVPCVVALNMMDVAEDQTSA